MVQRLDLLKARHEARDVRGACVVQVDVFPGIRGDVEEARPLRASHAAAPLAAEVGLRRVGGENAEPAGGKLGTDDELEVAAAQRAEGDVPAKSYPVSETKTNKTSSGTSWDSVGNTGISACMFDRRARATQSARPPKR